MTGLFLLHGLYLDKHPGWQQMVAFFYFGIYGADGDEVYKFDPSNGNSELLYTSPDLEDSFGMTFDGTHLWITDHAGSSTSPAYAMQFDFSGNLLDQFDLPDHYMSGIEYDNGDFWVATYYPDPGTIYKVDINGNILNQFQYPGDQPWDLCLENDNFWFADYNDDMIYKTDINGSLLESHASENIQPSGITFDGQYCGMLMAHKQPVKFTKLTLVEQVHLRLRFRFITIIMEMLPLEIQVSGIAQ